MADAGYLAGPWKCHQHLWAMIQTLLLPVLLLLLSDFFLLTSSSIIRPRDTTQLNNGEACIQSIKCKSGCCRRDPSNCESHCTDKGSEDDWCHTQTFLGLYNECPCLPDLTCIFPKNMKTFKITYGLCKKIVVKKKLTKRGFF